jgi:hypothetical protein
MGGSESHEEHSIYRNTGACGDRTASGGLLEFRVERRQHDC